MRSDRRRYSWRKHRHRHRGAMAEVLLCTGAACCAGVLLGRNMPGPAQRIAGAGAIRAAQRRRLTRVSHCAGLCYCYAGIAHSYLTSQLNEGTAVPKGRIEMDGGGGHLRAATAAEKSDGLLSPGSVCTPPASPQQSSAGASESECSSGAASRPPSSLSL